MNKTELENAIKNKERIWVVQDGKIFNTVLKADIMENGWGDYWKNFVYKNKSEAEHYLNHANITRTETLPFLTWEEFLKKEYVEFFNGGKGFRLYVSYINCDHIRISKYDRYNPDGDVIFEETQTEENFYKAYDECVRLFKGE